MSADQDKPSRGSSTASFIAVVLMMLLAVAIYVSSYLALVRRAPGIGRGNFRANYRVLSRPLKIFYAPANWIDRSIRTQYWQTHLDAE